MSENKKQQLVPRVRFPEFRDAGEWITVELGKLSRLLTERVGSATCTPYTITSGVGLISQEEKLGRTIAGNSLKNYLVLQENDFAYNKSATKAYPQGFIALYAGGERAAVPNSIFTCFRVNQNQVIPTFLDALFASNLHGKWLRTRIAVGARAHGSLQVSDDDLMATPVPLPNGTNALEEQQKIADCLSSLDDLIAAETQKLDTLKTHKKGLMQQLFPREGETVPRLRFPEFQGAGEWEEKTLDQVSPSIFDGTHQTPKYAEEGVPFFSVENIVSGNRNKFISEEDHIAATRKNKPEKGDVLITRIGNIGYSTVVHWDYEFSIYVTLAVVKRSPSFNSNFLHGYFQSSRYQKELRSKSLLDAVPCKINMEELRKTEVLVPEIDEQHKIANCLSALDDLIAAQAQKIELLKRHKKGLMQQLFPVLEDVPA
ncbi:MAG: restriction endonuclease subunit S [Pseudomonadota bacterium]